VTQLEAITEKLRAMPSEQQRELLDFADSLLARRRESGPVSSIGDTCEDLGVSISAAQLDAMRGEMWVG